jgi:exodeoxyribonuclease-5
LERLLTAARQPRFIINPEAPIRDARLVVLDECSMVGEEIADDLRAFGKPI